MRFEHADAGPERVVEAVTSGFDPEHNPNDGEVEKENDVGDIAIGKGDCNNGGAAGDGPVRRDIEPLPPDHDAAQLAAIEMRNGIDVARVVNAFLPRTRRFVRRATGIV